MASIQRPLSSGSDGGNLQVDERKRKRQLSNKESAKRSRLRKQKQIEDLTVETSRLRDENKYLIHNLKAKEEAYVEMEAANGVIRAQMLELADRLRFLNSMLEIAGEVSGVSVEIPQIPDPLLKPWHITHPIHPLMASPDMFLR